MSSTGAPDQASLWTWLEKDLVNLGLQQKYMSSEVKKNEKIKNKKLKRSPNRNEHRKAKKKKKASKSSKVHFNTTQQQNRIHEYLEVNTELTPEIMDKRLDYFGESHTKKADGTIRLWFTNPCGIGVKHDDIKSHDSMNFLRSKSRCDIFGFAETNVNWFKLKGSSTFYSRVKQSWKDFRTATCHNSLEDLGINQRGGNSMAVVGQAAFRMTKSGKDKTKLGRWLWMEFSGRDEHVTRIYTAYRPCANKSAESQNTTVYDQQDRYIRAHSINKTPREMFDCDLHEEILHQMQRKNIVIMLDANEDVENGEFNNMMQGLGLRNGVSARINSTMPATHHRGSRPISAIYCSRNLVVTRSGILPIGMGVRGDHRNIYLDVQTKSLMGGDMYMVIPPPMRKLKLNDSRIYLCFIKLVKKHLISNNVMQLANQLYNRSTYPATVEMIKDMEKIDEQMGRAIQHGLKKCRKLRTGEIPFSALFNTLSRTNRLWHLTFKKKKGQKISNTTIRRLSKQVGISNPLGHPMKEVINQMRISKRQYELFIPHAPTERMRFYEDMASANAANLNKRKENILKNIMQVETSRQQHASIRRVFPKKLSTSKKVDRVQVRKNEVWEEVTNPLELIKELQKENEKKYRCTENTPLMKRNIHIQMGNFAEGKLAKEIQNEHVDPHKFFDEWTSLMLSQTVMDPSIPPIPIEIKEHEVKEAWRRSKENKASSPSGRYNATYKAMCEDTDLLKIITTHLNLPFRLGQPYRRWSTFLDIMAFKKEHSTRVDTLRSIIISEGDWNIAGRIYVTRKMMQQAEKLSLLPEEHLGGRKGRKSIEGAITKRLFLDNSRLLQKPAVILSTDAANCYDRMVHKFICMMCKKWGLQEQVLRTLLYPLQTAQHYTRTAYGDSSSSFKGTNLQGAGQGNTSAAPFWTCVSTPMISLLKKQGLQASMQGPLSLKTIVLTLMAFVDDTEVFLMIDDDDIQSLLQLAHTTLKTWKKVLQATGGDMRAKKCAWILIHYKNKLAQSNKNFNITLEDEDGVERQVERYGMDDPREYLGVQQQASGDESSQLEALKSKVNKWNATIKNSKLTNVLNYSAVFSRIHKSLQYPLPATTLSEDDLQELSNKLYEVSLPRCGINRKFPIKYRHLPEKYQGLALPNLYLHQETSKLLEVLTTNNTKHILWDQYRLGMEILQMQTGMLECVLNTDYEKFHHLVEETWITSQWKFMWKNNLKMKGWNHEIAPQRVGDKGIMETFARKRYSAQKMKKLNTCRRYLNALTISDVVNGNGKHLCPMAIDGKVNAGRCSIYKWERIKNPPLTYWYIWRESLRETLCNSSTQNDLVQPLGLWTNTSLHEWFWFFHQSSNKLYHIIDGHCKVYRRSSRRSMNLRTHTCLYKANGVIKTEDIPTNVHRAIAEYEGRGYLYAKYYGSANSIDSQESVQQQQQQYAQPSITLSKNQKWIAASSNLDTITEEQIDDIMNEPIRIVADGSYKNDKGAMAVILEPVSQKRQMISMGPVPANYKSPTHVTDPYRCEMAGLLAGLTILEKMEKMSGKTTVITLSCDNDAALRVATEYSYFNSRMKHFDMARALILKNKKIKSTILAEPVLGHADVKAKHRKLTRAEILNQSCDRLAKEARTIFEPVGNQRLDEEGLSLWYKHEKINHDARYHIAHSYHHRIASETLCEKYKWSSEQFEKVDWKANEKAMSIMTKPTCIWISKYVTKFLPIGRNMERIGKWTMSYCPRCCREEETHEHLLKCEHIPSRELLQSKLKTIENWMIWMKTPKELMQQILALISQYLNLPHPKLISFHEVIRHQLSLGPWEHFMQGRFHKKFAEYMTTHYETIKDKKKTGKAWSAGLSQRIWTLLHRSIWDLRNRYVHEKLNANKRTRTREDIMQRVTDKYESTTPSTLLAKDRNLYEKSLDELLKSSTMVLRAWLLSFEVACQMRDTAYDNDLHDSSRSLRSWLCQRTRPSRIPIRKRRVAAKNRRKLQHQFSRIEKISRRVQPKKRKQMHHNYIIIGEDSVESPSWGSINSMAIANTGFFKPP